MPGIVKGESLIGQWTVPLQGTLRGLPPYAIPQDAVYDSLNVLVRQGAVVPRSGITNFDLTPLGSRPVGAFSTILLASGAFQTDTYQNDTFQLAGNTANNALVVATNRKIWAYFSGVWHDLTNAALTASADNPARLTAIEIANTINIVIVNGTDVPQLWDTTTAQVANLVGTPAAPTWSDITTASDRLIGIIPPYTIQWGNSLSLATFPALNFRTLADTIDPVVAIRNLGTLGVVVYKTRSIWVGQPGGATDASYFAFTLRGFWEGPASSAAVVDADGIHFYMTNIGRLAAFDGTQQQWVCDGLWPAIKSEIDQAYVGRIFGTFDALNNEVSFYYPRVGDSGQPRGIATIKLPNVGEGIAQPVGFRGLQTIPVSCGTDARLLTTRQTFLFGDQSQVGYTLGGPDDDGTNFSGYFQPGLIAAPAMDLYRLEGFEVFMARGAGRSGTLAVKVVSNNLLENPDTTNYAVAQPIDLSQAPPTQPEGADVTGKFFGLRFEFTTPISLKWFTARLAARRIEPDQPSAFAQMRGYKVAS